MTDEGPHPPDRAGDGPPAAESAREAEAAADVSSFLDADEARQRAWIRTLVPLLQGEDSEPCPNPRVQFALERLRIAACERVIRILSSDIAGPPA